MKISFSTLGCPDYSWTDIYTMAKDLGYHGIEIRGLGNDILATRAKPFSEDQLPKTVAKLREIGIEVSCLSSGIALKYQAKLPKIMDELTSYAKLANALGTAYIRVLADEHPAPEGEVDDEAIIATLKQLVPIAEQYNVTMLVETNGVYSDTTRLKKILDASSVPQLR